LDDLDKQLLLNIDKLQSEFGSLKSVQEKKEIIQNFKTLFDSRTVKLDQVIPPSVVIGLKGRSKNTKREKIGLEHIYDDIKKKQKLNNSIANSQSQV
jgi:hypothetical protein